MTASPMLVVTRSTSPARAEALGAAHDLGEADDHRASEEVGAEADRNAWSG
jgi:hypothetical protein